MDRRTFMAAGAGLAALGGAVSWLDGYGRQGNSTVLLLIDKASAGSREHAAFLAEKSLRVIDIGEDVGVLWHSRLRDWPGPITGALRPSDCFVLRTLSFAARRTFHTETVGSRLTERSLAGHGAIAFWIDAMPGCRAQR